MVAALQCRPSADHSREGTSTASILAGPAVPRRRSSPRPRSPHCCRCCDEAPIAAVVVPAPFSLSSFLSVPLLLILALSRACSRTRVLSPSPASLAPSRECSLLSFFLSLSFLARASPTRACSLFLSLRSPSPPFLGPPLAFPRSLSRVLSHARPLSLSRFSRSLSRVFSILVLSLSLSLLVRASPTRACSPSLSLSLRVRASPLARVLSFSLSLSLAPSRSRSRFSRSLSRVFSLSLSLSLSRRSAGSAHLTCRAMSRAAYPVSPLRPFRRPSLRTPWRPPRHVASLPGPAGYTPPLDGSR
jgi:hypothetical protein